MAEAQPGLFIVDKPRGMTSHDVVSRIRRLVGTRRVGHAGTLDPMATGVLIIGIGQATRLLGHLALSDKAYLATIRLGVTTTTDDAEGDHVSVAEPEMVAALSDDSITKAMATLTGSIDQVPPAISAIKVKGVRSYRRARSGEPVELAARPVTVSRFELLGRHAADLEVAVCCTSGTYIRALARDLGTSLEVGGHLTALRRTRVGGFDLAAAVPLDALDPQRDVVKPVDAARSAFPCVEVDGTEAVRIRAGQRRPIPDRPDGRVAIVDSGGLLTAIADIRDGVAHPIAVFHDPGH